MGIIDPAAIGGMMATGVLEYSNGPTLWLLTVGLLAAAAAAVALSALRLARVARLRLPRLGHGALVAAGVSRAK
jgi:hypothetical protein